ncbi:MAG: TonB-dependent receptor [Pseudomonadota bacterium]|nr:TonB-dependent receptor [Pseudomonadota bacterium]
MPAASSVTVVERATLESSQQRNLNRVLRGLPGVNLHRAGSGTTLSSVSVRGVQSGQGQFTLDGIPLYSGVSGAFNLSAWPADALERIEVVRGVTAPRYGGRGAGGVIRLFTRDERESGGFVHLEGGSYGALSSSIGAGAAGDAGRLTVTANDDEVFDGISHADQENGNPERDGYHGRLGAARFALAPAHRFTLDGSLLYKRSRAEIDGPGTLPDGRPGLRDDLTAFGIEETWVAQTQPSVALNRRWNSSLQLGFTRNRVATRVRDTPFGFDNRLLLARWTNDHLLYEGAPGPTGDRATTGSAVSFRWGGEVQQEEGGNQFDRPGLPLHGARTIYTGLTESQAWLGRMSGFAGVRVDHYDDLGMHPTAYGGLAYAATNALTVRASGGNTYRAPAFHELFFIPFSGQPGLEPERSVGADLGIDWSPRPASHLSLTGYYSRLDDLIQLTFAPELPGLFVSENIAEARIWGFEVEGEYRWGSSIDSGFEYTYANSTDLVHDRELRKRPRHQGRIYTDWQTMHAPLSVFIEAVYRGRHFDDDANQLLLEDAVYLNAQASYRVNQNVLFYVRGENLNDDRTPETFSFGVPGAAVFGGVRVELP